ncbi:DUF4870 domain-containing protein [Alkalitalea saponilacus]|uniref:DUF4870 domain-containing protein n=1 Tax=Alkalitalea saponilacus TaxID=889453 RepID=A0A1T5HQK2_9BACT|nr:DUF4870 domain-containing protein [Alkalitalea saponilacus]ASB48440.1 orotate phosphoribosyltransferase [Alkalitalea saponilacus]SKC22922.1 hypothetical protein SAMN03080601_02613 [Alkalitalea saponilacus]
MTEKNWHLLCHLSALAMFIIPFGNIVGPLIIWLLKKDEFPIVDQEGKESLNFQITVSIAVFVAGILTFVLIGIPLLILIALANIILIIMASVEANNGRAYKYPFNLRLIK